MLTIKEIRDLRFMEKTLIIFGAFALVSPGLFAIWMFAPDLIKEASTPKLVLLAAGAMIPFVLLNSIYADFFLNLEDDDVSTRMAFRFFFGMNVSGFGAMALLTCAFRWSWDLTLFLTAIMDLQTGFFIVAAAAGLIRHLRRKRKLSKAKLTTAPPVDS